MNTMRQQTVATIEQMPAALPEARPAGQTVTSDVLVPALQNLLGGFGAGVFVERVLSIWTPLLRDDVTFWAMSVGFLVFGLATATRAFRDEIVILIHAWAERRNRQDMTDLMQERDDLRTTIITLNAEIDRLASLDGGSGNGAIVLVAYRLLSDYYTSGLAFTQTAVLDRKVCSRPVWNVITGFLKAAKIINGNGGVLIDDLQIAFHEFMRVHTACTHSERVGGKLVKVYPPTK